MAAHPGQNQRLRHPHCRGAGVDGTSQLLGQRSTERMDSVFHKEALVDKKIDQAFTCNKVGGTLVTGNKNEVHSMLAHLVWALHEHGFSIPTNTNATGWARPSHAHGKCLVRLEDLRRGELVAELGAAFLSNAVGLDLSLTEPSTTGYLANWLQVLRNDKCLIISAAN